MSNMRNIAEDPLELQASLGLPAEKLWKHALQYHPATSTIVLSVVISRNRIPYSRIYLRNVMEEGYRPALPQYGDDHSVEGPVLSKGPFMFFVVSRWLPNGGDFVNESLGLGRLDLRDGESEVWSTDAPGTLRFFVSELAAATSNGDSLYAACGFRNPNGVGAVEYALTELDWESRSVRRLTNLEGVCF